VCYPGYQALDCSERVCLFGRSWGDIADGNDQAHDYSECSSNGLCDRKTGECTCNDGFTGDACRYAACPNDCNGHGTCEFISELAVDGSIQYGSVTDRKYDLWDAQKSRACKCDAYWGGVDCSSRMCPKGNDPLTTMTKDTLGGNTAEVQEVQTVDIRPQLHADDAGYYSAIGGDFTLSYTDAYNQEWTTRPIRVSTQISNTKVEVDALTPAYLKDIDLANTPDVEVSTDTSVVNQFSSTITDAARRLNLFEPYDTIKYTNPSGSWVTTITSIDCTYTVSAANAATARPCTMTVMPQISARAAAIEAVTIQLVSTDTGEIGVKRMLQELPNQVIPSVTVDETIGLNYNGYQITFSDAANSGDQHMLKCKVASCDSDGCQPRKKAIKGLYRVALKAHASATGSTSSLVAIAAVAATGGAFTNFQNGAAEFQDITTPESRSIVISGATATTLTLNAAYVTQMTNDDLFTVSQIQDFTDDSIGEITGGDNAEAHGITDRATNTQLAASVTFVLSGAGNKLTTTGMSTSIVQAGDMISVKCATNAANDGYYKVSKSEATGYTLEGHMTADGTGQLCVIKKIVASPCVVTETQKGTSELETCSRHGNCDSQTGLCTCFSGYVGEDCSTQTVLV
jgi:hypothetical protein